MNFDEYQKLAQTTARYPDVGKNFLYPTLGLAGEAGEVANKIKKIFRDNGSALNEQTRETLKKELGDVLWYVAQLSTELGLTMDGVAAGNIEKLKSRHDRGVIGGDGDNR